MAPNDALVSSALRQKPGVACAVTGLRKSSLRNSRVQIQTYLRHYDAARISARHCRASHCSTEISGRRTQNATATSDRSSDYSFSRTTVSAQARLVTNFIATSSKSPDSGSRSAPGFP